MRFAQRLSPLLTKQIAELGPSSALARQFLATDQEQDQALQQAGCCDPTGDLGHEVSTAGSGLIHRYPNRALILIPADCPSLCRFCFRRNRQLLRPTSAQEWTQQLQQWQNYLQQHNEIEELILSGGEPLALSTRQWVARILTWPHQYLRIHTRLVVTDPQQIDDQLIAQLKLAQTRVSRLIVVVHINHYQELYPAARTAIGRLIHEAKVQVLGQSVLLRGINDQLPEMVKTFKTLLECQITPYYLHQLDRTAQAMHFEVPLEEGLKLYGQLSNHLPGWAIPKYVMESEQGGGKIPLTLWDRHGNILGAYQPVAPV